MNCTHFRAVPMSRVAFEDNRRWLALWERARGDAQRLPAWGRDLSFSDVPPEYVPRMAVLELAPDIADSVYRFWGTALTRPFGENLRDRRFGELSDPAFAAAAAGQYAAVVAARSPCFFAVRVKPFRVGEGYEGRLRLPFGADGETVDTVLSVQFAEKDGFAIRPLWDDGLTETPQRAAIG